MSSTPPPSRSMSVSLCSSCHIVLDSSNAGPLCPSCGLASIAEITATTSLELPSIADVHGDLTLDRNGVLPSEERSRSFLRRIDISDTRSPPPLNLVLDILSFLSRISREPDLSNQEEDADDSGSDSISLSILLPRDRSDDQTSHGHVVSARRRRGGSLDETSDFNYETFADNLYSSPDSPSDAGTAASRENSILLADFNSGTFSDHLNNNIDSSSDAGDTDSRQTSTVHLDNSFGSSLNTGISSSNVDSLTGEDAGNATASPQETSRQNSIRDMLLGPALELLLEHLAQAVSVRYGSPPASKAAIEAMPLHKFSKEHHEGEEDVCCAVCREAFEVGSELKEMPCKHIYHPECILPWLELHCTCPLCRTEIPAEESRPVANSGTSEDNLGENVESAEIGLAIFEISGEGVQVISFVFFTDSQRNENESVETQGNVPSDEMQDEESVAEVVNLDGVTDADVQNNIEDQIVDQQKDDGKIASHLPENHFLTNEISAINNYESGRTSSPEDESGVSSGIVEAGYMCQNGSSTAEPVQRVTSREAKARKSESISTSEISAGPSHSQSLAEVRASETESLLSVSENSRGTENRRLSDTLDSFVPRVRNFFSWVFAHTSSSQDSRNSENAEPLARASSRGLHCSMEDS